MQPQELAQAIGRLVEWAHENTPRPEAELPRRLREHLGADLRELDVVTEELSSYDHVNLQVAIDADLEREGSSADVIGLAMDHGFQAGLAEIAQRADAYGFDPGPVVWIGVDVGDRTVQCIKSGVLLIDDGDGRLAALIAPGDHGAGLGLQVMSAQRAHAEAWLARIRALMRERNVYRGKVLAFGGGEHPFRPQPLSVRRLPEIERERIVLPEGTLERVERQTVGFARHRDALRAAGRHIKRGILLHGPPGTGKTLTIMYLAGLMPERTIVLLTGETLGAVGPAVHLARSLEPAMVVMEDVDLVALERSHYSSSPVLFELLNAMEGLDEDADLIFALTTNRPELLEPALASRPGRIDLAVELPLPDAVGRRRLLELYAEGLELESGDLTPAVEATDGVSPAFIRELMRRAALARAERGGEGAVAVADLVTAADELKHQSGRLTASLLGAEPPPPMPPMSAMPDEGLVDEEW